MEQIKINNWQTYPLHKPEEGKVYETINLQGLERLLKFKSGAWYKLDNRYTLNQPVKFRDEKK